MDGRTDGRKDKWTDRRTDTTKLIIAFRNFENARKKKEGRRAPKNERKKKVRANGQENSREIPVALIARPQIKTKEFLFNLLSLFKIWAELFGS